MMRRLIKSIVFCAAVGLVAAPTQARADGWVNPWAGVNFGSSAANDHGGFGVNAGAMGAGAIGGEVAFGYSPSFFGTEGDFGRNNLLDLMGNVIVGVPIGGQHGAGFRPYVTGGLGLIRAQTDGGQFFPIPTTQNMFGWNAGVGVMGFFNDHVGLRADVRYTRTVDNSVLDALDLTSGDLHYWRTGFGLVIR